MDKFIAAFATLVLLFFMATLALFLVFVETVDAASVDATLTGPASSDPSVPGVFTLTYQPSMGQGVYSRVESQLQVNGSLWSLENYILNPAIGVATFSKSLLAPGTDKINVVLSVLYYNVGGWSGGTTGCGYGGSCTLHISAGTIGQQVYLDTDTATASLSLFAETAPQTRVAFEQVALLQELSPVPLAGSLPLFASGLILFGLLARRRQTLAN